MTSSRAVDPGQQFDRIRTFAGQILDDPKARDIFTQLPAKSAQEAEALIREFLESKGYGVNGCGITGNYDPTQKAIEFHVLADMRVQCCWFGVCFACPVAVP